MVSYDHANMICVLELPASMFIKHPMDMLVFLVLGGCASGIYELFHPLKADLEATEGSSVFKSLSSLHLFCLSFQCKNDRPALSGTPV